MQNKTTCQICEREIKATTGVIAHHGYTRPYQQGWQSGSCFGARYQPYEVACDALPPAIENCAAFITRQKAHLEDFTNNPPADITVLDRWGIGGRKTFTKPKEYVYNPEQGGFSREERYALEHHNTISEIKKSIKHAEWELPKLQKRLENWVAPIKPLGTYKLPVGASDCGQAKKCTDDFCVRHAR